MVVIYAQATHIVVKKNADGTLTTTGVKFLYKGNTKAPKEVNCLRETCLCAGLVSTLFRSTFSLFSLFTFVLFQCDHVATGELFMAQTSE